MPVYEYKCEDCNNNFSVLQSMKADEKGSVCTKCGSSNVRKKISSFSCCNSSAGLGGGTPPMGTTGGT